MRKIKMSIAGWITATCLAMCLVLLSAGSVAFAEPVYEAAPCVDIQIRLVGAEEQEYEIGTLVPAQLEAVLLVRDQQAGIASVFYSIEADGQGWNYQIPVCSPGEFETSPDPSTGYDNVQQGLLEEWNILEAEGDTIHCMSRTVYVYAQYNAVIRLAFTDQMGNLYSYQEDYLVGEPAWELPAEVEEPAAEVLPEEPAAENVMLEEPVPEEVAEIMPEEPVLEAAAEPLPEEVDPEGLQEAPPEAEDPAAVPENAGEVQPEEAAAEELADVMPEEPVLEAAAEPLPEGAEPEGLQEASPEAEEPAAIPEAAEAELPEEPGPEAAAQTQDMVQEMPVTEVPEMAAVSEPAALEDLSATETKEMPAASAMRSEEEQMQQPKTWSSYSGTPSYYYPQPSYSTGTARGTSAYTGSAGSGSYKAPAVSPSKTESALPEKSTAESADPVGEHAGKEEKEEKNNTENLLNTEEPAASGSVYDLSAIEKYNGKYLKGVEDLVIYESNTAKILPHSVQVLVSRNDETMELEQDVDYVFALTGTSAEQNIYKYTIKKDVFSEDGTYRIYLLSEDEAGGHNSSESQNAAVWFSIDNVSPLILSVESTKEQETKGVREIRIKDDTQLSDIEIYLGSQKVEFEADGETYRFPVSEEIPDADVKVIAKDRAGNTYERVLTNYVHAGKAKVRAGMNPVPVIMIVAAGSLSGVLIYRKYKTRRRARKAR